jgi:hypothetical protein
MVDYILYQLGNICYCYKTTAGTIVDIDGYGYTMIRFDLGDGCFNNIVVKSYYKVDLNVNLLASKRIKYKEGI